MDIKVLGACCANCKNTATLIEQVAREKGVAISLTKVEDMKDIVSYGVMSVPGVVIDGTVVHVGSIPPRAMIEKWLTRTINQ